MNGPDDMDLNLETGTMGTDWYSIDNVQALGNRVQASLTVDSESPWFQGHFPGNPILPGVAQLAFVAELIRHAFGSSFYVTEIRKVRFKRMIRPGEPLQVIVESSRDAIDRYHFRIECDQTLAGKGVMIVAQT